MPTFRDSSWVNSRGQSLYTVEYKPEGEPRAILCWHHGYAEHIGRYTYVFNKFAEAGFLVRGYDCHGHGKSEPHDPASRSYVESFQHLVQDFHSFIRQLKSEFPTTTPLFVGGHSMGGLVAVETVLRDQSLCRGLLLSSALLYKELSFMLKVQVAVGAVLAAVAPRARIVQGVDKKFLNKDPNLIEEYVNDPLNDTGEVRVNTARELMQAMQDVEHHEQQLTVPIFAFHGTEDGISSPEGSRRLISHAASKDKTLWLVEGGYHEMLHNPDERDDLIGRMITWMSQHIPSSRL